MGLLLAFAPFILFVSIERLVGGKAGVLSAAGGAAVLLARNLLSGKKSVKVREVGTVVLFGSLAVYTCFVHTTLPVAAPRVCVDAGMLLVVLVSMGLRRPFTLQYAREQVAAELWNKPGFMRAKDVILLAVPRLPALVGIGATVLAIVGAVRFTSWYPSRIRSKQGNFDLLPSS